MSSKLRVVARHEFLTIVKQPSFWISLTTIPLLVLVIVLIGHFTGASDEPVTNPEASNLSIAIIDESGLIEPDVAAPYGATFQPPSAQSTLTDQVIDGELDGLIVYPANLQATNTYQVTADNTEQDNASTLSAISSLILQQSLLIPLESDELAALALTGGEAEVSSYSNGQPGRDFVDYVIPASFLVIFFVILIFSISYALSSVSEEKENRSIEMVLSYVKPRTLILGKLLGIVLVTLTQLAFLAAVVVVSYFVLRTLGNDLSLPLNLSDITFDPTAILFGAAFLIIGFTFYVSAMATIGAIFPSTKEASGFSTVFFILPALPFWAFNTIVTEASNMYTQIVTYFPFSAPTTNLLRNAAGNLSVAEGVTALVVLIAATIVTLLLASKAFRLGMLEYNSRIKLSDLFKRQ